QVQHLTSVLALLLFEEFRNETEFRLGCGDFQAGAGATHIHVHPFAQVLQFFELLAVFDMKALNRERGFAPRAINARDEHPQLEIVGKDFLSPDSHWRAPRLIDLLVLFGHASTLDCKLLVNKFAKWFAVLSDEIAYAPIQRRFYARTVAGKWQYGATGRNNSGAPGFPGSGAHDQCAAHQRQQ